MADGHGQRVWRAVDERGDSWLSWTFGPKFCVSICHDLVMVFEQTKRTCLNVSERDRKTEPENISFPALTSHLLCACFTGYLTFEGFQLISLPSLPLSV